MKKKKLIIVGVGEFGHIAFEYFTDDSEYEVVAFAAEKKYIISGIDEETGLAIVPFEELEKVFPPSDGYETFVAITYVNLNRARRRLFRECKAKGYTCASYISSYSFFWKNAEIGENSFVFENNTIQYHVRIGNNVVLWSGNHIGHRTVIHDDCWLTSHNVISGFCEIDSGCFLGVNATLGDNVKLAKDVVLGAGGLAIHDLDKAGMVYIGSPAKVLEGRTAYSHFNVDASEI